MAWLVLCGFLLRALLPAGFMPDLQALQDGRFEIVICTPDGYRTLPSDPGAQPDAPDDNSGSGQGLQKDCAFQAGVAKAFLAPLSATAAMPEGPPTIASPLPAAEMPGIRQAGPPLGARGPPRHLV